MENPASKRTIPEYHELGDGAATGVFGADDWLGCLNLLTPERTRTASQLITTGEVLNLNASISDYNDPPFFGQFEIPGWEIRRPPKHSIFEISPWAFDEKFDGFFTHHSTQWDHFLHHGDPANECFYNGHTDLARGVEVWAEAGVAGRGVLLDVARWAEERGAGFDWLEPHPISPSDLMSCAEAQGVSIEEGTILLLRTGWETGYRSTTQDELVAVHDQGPPSCPGLEGTVAMAELLWNWGIAAIACDNPCLDVYGQDYYTTIAEDQRFAMHVHLLGRLGIPIGEFFLLDALAERCAEQNRYEFFMTSAPLNIRGAVGTSANALAIL
jgi:kynurenine formamidase